MRRINRFLCLWVLPLLLLCTFGYVWLHADIFLLWLHGLHLLCILLDAWDGGFPCRLVLCPSHIQIHQVWVSCLLEDEEQQSCTRFWCHLEVPNIEKVSSRVQQEQLEIAMFQIRPLFIGTGNEPINLLCLCDCCDKNCLFLRPMYHLLVTSDSTITLLEPWHGWISVEDLCSVLSCSLKHNNRCVENMGQVHLYVYPLLHYELLKCRHFLYSCLCSLGLSFLYLHNF